MIQVASTPSVISFDTLLEIFWQLPDPTTLNRQGNDVGTQYRSAIFYHNEKQEQIAPFTNFYPAEDYHKEDYERNRSQPYCMYVIDPKVQKLLKEYKNELKGEVIG